MSKEIVVGKIQDCEACAISDALRELALESKTLECDSLDPVCVE